jgi:uncharacterized protein (UPF0332 family)
MPSKFEECMKNGMLRKIPADVNNAKNSIRQAEGWIQEAEKTFETGAYKSSVYGAYMGMFHAARALLYRDGYREKSHFCIARFIEAEYVEKGKLEKEWVDLLDYHREVRHNNQYDVNFIISVDEDKKAIETAKKFIKRFKQLLTDIY